MSQIFAKKTTESVRGGNGDERCERRLKKRKNLDVIFLKMDECGKRAAVCRAAASEGVMWLAHVAVTFQPTWGS